MCIKSLDSSFIPIVSPADTSTSNPSLAYTQSSSTKTAEEMFPLKKSHLENVKTQASSQRCTVKLLQCCHLIRQAASDLADLCRSIIAKLKNFLQSKKVNSPTTSCSSKEKSLSPSELDTRNSVHFPTLSMTELKSLAEQEAILIYQLVEQFKTAPHVYVQQTVLSQGKEITARVKQKPSKDNAKIEVYEVFLDGKVYTLKKFSHDAPYGPHKHEFQQRALLIKQAALYNTQHQSSQAKLHQAIENLYTVLEHDLASIPTTQTSYADYQQYQKELHKPAAALIAQFTHDIAALISTWDSSFSANCKQGIAQLELWEKFYLMQHPHPIFINIFPLVLEGKEKNMVSMQAPASPTMFPSTVRNQIGLVNYVTSSWGSLETVNAKPKIVFDMQATRHSSLPPIHIADASIRQAIAMHNAKQLITDCANRLLPSTSTATAVGTSTENPLEIVIDSMMLFTAKMGDSLRNREYLWGKWKGESESLQLTESLLALSVYDSRPLQIDVAGRKIWVLADIQAINLGANVQATYTHLLGLLPNARIQAPANAEGMVRYSGTAYAFVEKAITQLNLTVEVKEALTATLQAERCDIPMSQASLQQRTSLQQQQRAIAQQLDRLQEMLTESYAKGSAPDKETVQRFDKHVHHHTLLKNKIYASYQREHDRQQAHFKRQSPLNQLLQGLAKDYPGDAQINKLSYFYSTFRTSQESFYQRRYENADTVMEFQTMRLEATSMQDHQVQFNCKSAEDRTGNVDNKLGERIAFKYFKGRAATPADSATLAQLTHAVHYGAANLDNTGVTGAAGLQIGASINMALGDKAKIGTTFAKQAKGVFTAAKQL